MPLRNCFEYCLDKRGNFSFILISFNIRNDELLIKRDREFRNSESGGSIVFGLYSIH